MAVGQFGGGRMGGVNLVAGGMAIQNFANIPRGPVARFLYKLSFSLKSTAAAFALVISTGSSAAAEGVDDADITALALNSLLGLYWSPDEPAFNLDPTKLRTCLGLFNQRDLEGTMMDGGTVPVSTGTALAFSLIFTIPVSLDRYFKDGMIFANGSEALRDGRLEITAGASLTPTLVLANGSAVVSGVSIDLKPEMGAGTEGDIGHTWRIRNATGLSNPYQFDDQLRLAILHQQPAATSAAVGISTGSYENWSPDAFAAKYQGERLYAGGFNLSARVTPLEWIQFERSFFDFAAMLGKANRLDAVSGVTTWNVYDIVAAPPNAAKQEAIAARLGGGGATHTTRPAPPSVPPGSPVPAQLEHLLPLRINVGMAPPEAVKSGAAVNHVNAQSVGVSALTRQVKAAGFKALALFGRAK